MYYHTSACSTLLFEHGESPEGMPWAAVLEQLNCSFNIFSSIKMNSFLIIFPPIFFVLLTLESLNKLEQILLIFSKVTQLESNFKA